MATCERIGEAYLLALLHAGLLRRVASVGSLTGVALCSDEDPAAKATRDPVAPAERSAGVKTKVARRRHEDGTPIHSFQTLLADLATIVRNTCRTSAEDEAPTFTVTTQPTPLQQRARAIIGTLAVKTAPGTAISIHDIER